MRKFDLSTFNWKDIQEYHNNGAPLKEVMKKYKFSGTILNRARKEGFFFKKDIPIKHTTETKEKLSKSRKTYLSKNPEKHPWKKNNKQTSMPCEKFKKELTKNGISFIAEYQPLDDRFFSIDVAFPDVKIGIAINGNQHYNKNKTLKSYYQMRHNTIESNGWKLYEIHYSLVFNDIFLKSFFNNLKNNYTLDEVDYSFYVKEKKQKTKPKYGSIGKYRQATINKNYKNIHKPRIEKIKTSNIDFSKYGWVGKVSDLLDMKPQKINMWMKKYMLEFYESSCFKRK